MGLNSPKFADDFQIISGVFDINRSALSWKSRRPMNSPSKPIRAKSDACSREWPNGSICQETARQQEEKSRTCIALTLCRLFMSAIINSLIIITHLLYLSVVRIRRMCRWEIASPRWSDQLCSDNVSSLRHSMIKKKKEYNKNIVNYGIFLSVFYLPCSMHRR